MKKEQVLARMKEDCLVAVVRAKNYEQGEKVVDAIIAGGINFIELTMTMDDGDPVGFIKLMAEKYKGNDKIVDVYKRQSGDRPELFRDALKQGNQLLRNAVHKRAGNRLPAVCEKGKICLTGVNVSAIDQNRGLPMESGSPLMPFQFTSCLLYTSRCV